MMRIDPYRFRRRTAPDCAIYSINEALGQPASVVTATVGESEESIAIELPPLDDGNQHRLLIAAVMSEAPIMELSYGGVVVDYYHQINGELFTLVASLIDANDIIDHMLRINFYTDAGGAEVRVQPLWFGNVGEIIYAKSGGPGVPELFDMPNPAGYESVLLFKSAEMKIFDAEGIELTPITPELDYTFTEPDFPAVDMRFGDDRISRSAYFIGAFDYGDGTTAWLFNGWSERGSAAIMAISLCDVEDGE